MTSFEAVASVDDLTDPGTLIVEVQDQIVMLVKVEGQVFCIDDVCTHDGGSFDGGELCGHEITCPRHGAKFDVRTGLPAAMPATEPTIIHEVKVVDGEVLVRLCEDESDPAALKSAQNAPPELQGKTAAPASSEGGASQTPTSATTTSSDGQSSDGQSSEMPVPAEALPSASASSETAEVSATDLPPGAAAGELNEDRCREELKKVIDPELFVNIVDLGLIYTVTISDTEGENQHHVGIDMTMTSPMCPAGPQLIAQSKQVLMQLDSVSDVEVKVVMDPPWTPDKMTDDARDQLGIF